MCQWLILKWLYEENCTLRPGMNNHLRDETEEEVLDETESEAGLGPVVAPFKDLKHVAVELDLTIEVLLLESLDGNELLSVVCILILWLLEFQVVLNGLSRKLGFLVPAGSEFGGEPPEGTENRQEQDEGEENPGLEAHTPAPCDVCGDAD